MYTVYESTNGTQAHLIVDVLAQAGIDAQIVGEHLGPYANPLGSVRVLVPAEQAGPARQCVADWEAQQSDSVEPTPDSAGRSWLNTITVLVVVAALLVVLWYFTGV